MLEKGEVEKLSKCSKPKYTYVGRYGGGRMVHISFGTPGKKGYKGYTIFNAPGKKEVISLAKQLCSRNIKSKRMTYKKLKR